jgi:beta-glucanase (GH16 family)
MVFTVLSTLALAASAAALTVSPNAAQSGCYYTVSGVGSFNYHTSGSAATLPSDIGSSAYTVLSGTAPYARKFDSTNLGYSSANSALTLTVPGGQTSGPISSAQLQTTYSDILYGSVRTVAMVSSVSGTTHGFTFYSNDTQEIDFAFVTNNDLLVHLTNEQVSNTATASSYTYAAPSDATTAFHEYRVDWIPGASMFYIDGVLIKTITDNVPTTAGMWVWNNWSNGNTWALGPPVADSVLQIQSINAYFNRTSVAANIASGAQVCAVSSSSSSSSVKASSTSSTSVATSSSAKTSATSSSAGSTTTGVNTANAVVTSATSTKTTSTSSSTSSSAKSTSTYTAGTQCGTWYSGPCSSCCNTGLTCQYYFSAYYCEA